MTRFASVRVFSPTSPNILSEQHWSYKLWYTPSGVETGQGVPRICVWGAIVGYPAAKPMPVWALWASQHHPASPTAASVTAGLLVQLPSNHCRGPQTEVSGHICCVYIFWFHSKDYAKICGQTLPHICYSWWMWCDENLFYQHLGKEN